MASNNVQFSVDAYNQKLRCLSTGTFTMNGASPSVATVADTAVDANSIVLFSLKTSAGTPGATRVSAQTPATSFVVTGANGDTSVYNYVILSYA